MIDRYSDLPDVSIFLHDARFQWHNDNPFNGKYGTIVSLQRVNRSDAVISIKSLNLEFVKSTGYANLRCVWAIGCPSELEPARYLRDRPDDPDHPTAVEFPDSFLELFPGAQIPEVVATPCCSQFAVSRKRIRDRPIDDYIRYRDWLLNTSLPTDISGRIFEYSWHSTLHPCEWRKLLTCLVIFGKPAQHCVDPRSCYCKTYSLCDLTDEELENQWGWPY